VAIRVGINGFGRIGRNIYRAAAELNQDIDIVAVNDITDAETLVHLLRYDSALGSFRYRVEVAGEGFRQNGRETKVLSVKDPAQLPWKDLGVDIVLESTGLFTDAQKARAHIDSGGAKKVIITAPAKNQDVTIVMGVNEKAYDPKQHAVVSNASCTTNCFVPMAKVLHDSFGIQKGMMTTVHAYTADQRLQDAPHKDLRRARAAAQNIIPTTTGANKAVAEVLPELEGKFQGMAIRVPVIDVSVCDLSVQLEKSTTAEDVNAAFEEAADGQMRGILAVTHEELVSSDFKGDSHSSIVDAPSTLMLGDSFAKVVSWYDNEWGYSCRCVDLVTYMAERL
jgi:glyceraldehyde 3-phosphate dehydrogenase